ncbi:rna recognition motif domain containing protein [Nannochloropsis oceanica]
MFKITITCAFLMALASVHAFLPMPCRMPTNMKVGQSSSTGRSKSIGIINSMRENIEGEPNPTQIMVSNLPFDTSTEELEAFAAQAGQVVNVKIILDKETGRSKGYGFVLFTEPLSATYALERLDGMELGGRPLKIRPAIRKTYPNTRGGGYGGNNNNY